MAKEQNMNLDTDGLRAELEKVPLVPLTALKASKILGLNVMSSMPLMSGHMLQYNLPRDQLKCSNNSARHLNLIRSIPSENLVSTLVGMKTPQNIEQNLEVLHRPPLTQDEFYNYIMSVPAPEPEPEAPNANQ